MYIELWSCHSNQPLFLVDPWGGSTQGTAVFVGPQVSQSSENLKTESIWSKEHIQGVSNFWDHSWPSLVKLVQCLAYHYLLSNFLNNLSVCWFSHILTQVLQWQSCTPLVLFSEWTNKAKGTHIWNVMPLLVNDDLNFR